ncbi:hypothetical protein PRCB_06265 [Pantoea rodasii]|uniref:HipA N-terminal subdomain 1 domain-containing protein n=1 Tax=Pantoea rodasii TaxID=1076549 RepID=A0A2M9WFJ0_9GAMM|nr:HipA N-terminal domain-containing protein [Pantoea rodasii]PJZ06324.1 hypothetical protein PRCB_06265 [Pantoea rodasii]
MARKISVWLYNQPIGTLSEDPAGFAFYYRLNYNGRALSLSMPVRPEPYLSEDLHPFFKGLAPEGW